MIRFCIQNHLAALSALICAFPPLHAEDENAAKHLADRIVIPKVDFKKTDAQQAFGLIDMIGVDTCFADEAIRQKGTINIVLLVPFHEQAKLKTITLRRENISLHEAVKECAKQIGCTTRLRDNTIEIRLKDQPAIKPNPQGRALSDIEKRLSNTKLRSISFDEVTIEDIALYIEMVVNRLDNDPEVSIEAAFPEGLKYDEKPRITLRLRNESALTLLQYAAEIGGMSYTLGKNTVALQLQAKSLDQP